MAEPLGEHGCPNCERLLRRFEELERLCAEQQARLLQAERRVAELEAELAAARKNSGNSSKPPSSDIVKPKPAAPPTAGQRQRGAQPGHPKHERVAFDESQIDRTRDYVCTACPDCGGAIEPSVEPPRVIQQVELIEKPVEISEHRSQPGWCPQCQRTHYAPFPDEVQRAGLIGPRLTTFAGYLKGAGHCSYSTIQNLFRDVLGVPVSRGQLRKVCAKVADSLETSYTELLHALPEEERLNVDETGHKDNGTAMWTWCFRAPQFTLFKIDPSRSSQVLQDVLGLEFDGVLGCDYYSAYHKYMRLNEHVLVQFCLAHLIRDIKFLTTHPAPRNQIYGTRVLQATRELFALFHRRETLTAAQFELLREDAANELCGAAKYDVPETAEAQNLADRFWKHGDEYLRFLTTPGVEPTNNLAEQAIRFVVIDRRVTQGSRSPAGRRWLERIWTTLATCAQQGRSAFEFLHQSLAAHFQDHTPPSLLPDST